jgi:hypothetical protein
MGLVEEEKVARCAWGGQMASCEQEGRKGCSMASHTEERRGVGGVLVLMCDHGARGLALPAETGRGGGGSTLDNGPSVVEAGGAHTSRG